MTTFELKDNKGDVNYAARIQIKNTGLKKFIAMNWSLRQVLSSKIASRNYPLPDLEPGQTYDLIFNLNLKQKKREVTFWSLCLLDTTGEEYYFGDMIRAELNAGVANLEIIEQQRIPGFVTSINPTDTPITQID